MDYVAAFRTYSWNATVAELARRFFDSLPTARRVILADRSHGELGIPGEYDIIWHDNDASDLDIASYPPGKTHWYNVDYALYILRRAFPDCEAYVTCESDLAVNLPLGRELAHCLRQGFDAVLHDVKPSTPDWHWHSNGAAVFEAPQRALCFFMAMSARAIDALWEMRRIQTVAFEAGTLPVWPFCETFVPSVLTERGFHIAEVGSLANTHHLRFRPRLAADDPRANAPGSMAHSVLPRAEFFRSAIAESPPRDWFRPSSELRITLEGHPIAEFAGLLKNAFQVGRDHAGLQAFMKEAVAAGMKFDPEADLALFKPAMTSSTSPWSRHPEPWRDATCANGVDTFSDFAFHTSRELTPWWMVDMMDEYAIDEVRLVNRVAFSERFRQFQIESSRDGASWTSRYVKLDLDAVSANDADPFKVVFPDPFVARHVRIKLLGEEPLHLLRVQIFGRAIAQPSQRPFGDASH